MPLCRISSSVSCDASTETCGEKARRTASRTSLPPPPIRAVSTGEGDLTVDPVGEKIEPFTAVLGGVIVPESLGECPAALPGREVVEA